MSASVTPVVVTPDDVPGKRSEPLMAPMWRSALPSRLVSRRRTGSPKQSFHATSPGTPAVLRASHWELVPVIPLALPRRTWTPPSVV
ncbi:hypothetical protein EASAB2608_06538 [Streptomyces sp. EAS-AB2608]|nr:hypothetical protein EASAB2608_06538 [Streptomyces sp. EAS-AB2608]